MTTSDPSPPPADTAQAETREVYRVWYDDPRGHRCYVDVPRHRGIAYVREGVWLDKDGGYGIGLDCVNWLPPSRFVIVTKLTVPADEAGAGQQL